MERFFPIGIPGEPWTDEHRRAWFETCRVQRSYDEEVQAKVRAIADTEGASVEQYGSLPVDPDRYPLLSITLPATAEGAPWALITGGVHGYETSGVQGALEFVRSHALSYRDRVNLLVLPCVSPWGYEVIHRWNPNAIDPNRSFVADSPSEEAAGVMRVVAEAGHDYLMHIDLHETTDTDETEFRPALAARDGVAHEPGLIPDGFYTVGDTDNPQPEFQAAVIAGVAQVTHIAPADEHGQIIGSDVTQHGVINYQMKEWGLCGGVTQARFTTTTEVYPDSSHATPEICIEAQVAAVRAGLDFALAND